MATAANLLPNSPLRLWSLFVGLNRERYSTSEELLITTSDVCPKHWQPPASKVGGCSLFCTGSPVTFINMLCRASATGFTAGIFLF